MKDKDKTQKELLTELSKLRRRIAELEATEHKRKQTEEEIERLTSFPKLSPMPIVEVDQKGRLTYTNTAAQQIFPDLDKRQGKHPFLAGLKSYFPELQQKKRKYLVREVEVGSDWYSQIISLADPEYIRIYAIDITERKGVEDTLRDTSLFLRSILDSSSSISIIFTDLEQNILFWNKGAENIFGYKAEEVIDRHTVDILYPDEGDTKQTVEEIRSYILNKKRGLRHEIKEVTKDGRILWISLTSTPRFDENGNVIGILGIGEDITDRKQAEKTLEENEARFRQFFEHEPAYCYIISPEGVISDVNNTALGVLGYKKEELVGKPLQTIYAPESLPKMEQLYSKWKKTGQLKDEEIVIITKAGERRTVLLSAEAIRDTEGKIIHSISVQNDITERKNIEDALRESEERFRKVVETMKVGLATVDENGILTYVNEFSSNMIGYSVDEMLGHDPSDFLYDEEARKAQREIFEKRRKGMRDSTPYEVAWRTKDGRKVYSILSPTPIFDAEGRYKGSLAIHTEITGRKKTEKELRHSYQQMQEMLGSTVNALASTVEMKDQYTAGHQPRVAQLACAIAEEIGLAEEQIEGIRMAGLIHDIGKIMVPAEILNKPGPLTEIQYEMVKMHPRAAFDILKGIKFPWPVAEIVLQHHERMDGSGYPQGLSGEEILLEARILAVANFVEAMISHRPYRAAFDIKEPLAEISKNKGILYDSAVVDACLKLFSKKRFTFEQVH